MPVSRLSLQRSGIAIATVVYHVQPFLLLLLAALLWFGAKPQPAQWLGMALILGAVRVYRRGAQKT